MRLSLFYELTTPRPWDEGSNQRKIAETLDQIEFADQFGFHAVWFVEHHFLEEYAHSSAPEILLSGVSQRTRNIRLGHGIVNLLPPINHPLRVAERIGTLDAMSGGRVEFGSGEGSSVAELGAYGIDPGIKKRMWEESLQVAVEAMAQTPFPGIAGEFLTIPPRNVVPKPLQRPHPPLWMAATRRERIREAAIKGLGALAFAFVDPDASKAWVDEYYNYFESECVPVGYHANPNIAMTSWTLCAENRAEAARRVGEQVAFFFYATKHYYTQGTHQPGVTDLWEEFERSGEAEVARQRARAVIEAPDDAPPGTVGTSEDVIEYLRRYEEAGVDEVLLGVQSGTIAHEHIMETIERLGRDVVPQFVERDEVLQREKQRRIAGALDAAAARRPAPPSAPEDYSHGSILEAWEDGRAVGGMRESLEIQWQIEAGERADLRPEDAPGRSA
ncbi:LLM class flavin-dependent oxidoreductase [Pseudonocardia sp. NPDC049154]|uniref:LLM class flavin-dependent oxidoreductase n=1 Tax=Pseudonocardia sp. NPDC049154 TaxID=3155501 RepID=UPI0033E3EF73